MAFVLMFALCVPAFADTDDVRPSVEAKPAPEIVNDASGNPMVSIIDDTGAEISKIGAEITVTPLADASAATEAIKTALQSAFNEVKATSSLTTLIPNLGVMLGTGTTADDLVVTDLFDITLSGNYESEVGQSNRSLKITFTTSATEAPYVAVKCSNTWVAIDSSKITYTSGDPSTVTVIFDELCPVLIISRSSAVPPYTGDDSNPTIWWVGAGISLAVAATLIFVGVKANRKVTSK